MILREEYYSQMIVSEYVRGIKNNYVRIRELALPDERKYQYCIMKRGGITGFLPFEIRYIDSDAYMYYDITSRQNISTLYCKKPLDRNWIKSFFSSMKKIRNEAVRFLLDPANLIWNPTNVYQDLKNGNFGYLYVPYLDEDNGMTEMMDFLVSHVDYSDEELVRCVYSVAEQYKSGGDVYLQEKVYLDVEAIGEIKVQSSDPVVQDTGISEQSYERSLTDHPAVGPDKSAVTDRSKLESGVDMDEMYEHAEKIGQGFDSAGRRTKLKPNLLSAGKERTADGTKTGGILSFFERLRSKDRQIRAEYDFGMESEEVGAVAEETRYSDPEKAGESEGTVYVDLASEDKLRKLENENGKVIYEFRDDSCIIGTRKEDADLVMDETGISRMHARIFNRDEDYFLEDLNSTNGTFRNGLKLKPYEQKKLSKGDEIRLAGKKIYFM
jgi:hypothetical protein